MLPLDRSVSAPLIYPVHLMGVNGFPDAQRRHDATAVLVVPPVSRDFSALTADAYRRICETETPLERSLHHSEPIPTVYDSPALIATARRRDSCRRVGALLAAAAAHIAALDALSPSDGPIPFA